MATSSGGRPCPTVRSTSACSTKAASSLVVPAERVGPVAAGLADLGRDRARHHDRHSDRRADCREVVGEALARGERRELRHVVRRGERGRAQAGHRHRVDDVGRALRLEHARDERADPVQDPPEVHAERPLEVARRPLPDQAAREDARVVAEDVDLAERRERVVGERDDVLEAGDVGQHRADRVGRGAPSRSSAACSTSAATTRAPSAANACTRARPIPLPAPVTTTTLPSKLSMPGMLADAHATPARMRPYASDLDDLISQLTVDEKAAMVAGVDMWHTAAVERLGIPALKVTDGPIGARGERWTGGRSAAFPCGTALGATWDPELVREVGERIGDETRRKRAHVLLAPDGQHPPAPARRPQLRVLLRGPVPHRRASRSRTSPACSRTASAVR